MTNVRFRKLTAVAVLLLSLSFSLSGLAAAEEEAPLPEAAEAADSALSNQVMRAYLQLQEQIHETRLAIEQTRQESERMAARNAEMLATQLKAITDSMNTQRTRDIDALQSTSRFMLIVLSVFAGAGLIAIVLTAYFQWRAVSRLSEASGWSAGQPVGLLPGGAAAGASEMQLAGVDPVENSTSRLNATIQRLEKRISELEHTAQPRLPDQNGSHAAAATISTSAGNTETANTVATHPDFSTRVLPLLERGQSLLNSDKAEEAMSVFNDVLTLVPEHAEALVKKGAAFEKMRRHQEAIECYDRAIASDSSMTIAYLYKGGLFNRLERFSEAVECYEQALRTQEKRAVA